MRIDCDLVELTFEGKRYTWSTSIIEECCSEGCSNEEYHETMANVGALCYIRSGKNADCRLQKWRLE